MFENVNKLYNICKTQIEEMQKKSKLTDEEKLTLLHLQGNLCNYHINKMNQIYTPFPIYTLNKILGHKLAEYREYKKLIEKGKKDKTEIIVV